MARFGPTIWDELAAAGLGGESIVIEGDDIIIGSRFPENKRRALEDVLANHDPTKPAAIPKGPAESAIQALIDEGLVPPSKVTSLLNRVKGK
jgi:hypothetical protein